MPLMNKYGYSGSYGSGPYKGLVADAPGRIQGLSVADTKKCFHLGLREEQGSGWAEVQDGAGDWIWPSSQDAVVNWYDENGLEMLIVWDEADGLPYIINSRDGPTNSNLTKYWKDKVDPNVTDSGTEISGSFKRGEDAGTRRHYINGHLESHLHARPVKASDRSASGHDSETGLIDDLAFGASLYSNGKIVPGSTIESLPLDSEFVYDREVTGKTLQTEFTFNKSKFRISAIETYYNTQDQALIPSKGNTTEAGYQTEFSLPVSWLSRGSSLLFDRATSLLLTGAASATSGPDGKSNSAMTISTTVEIGNSAISNGTLLLWHESGYTISGVSLTSVTTSGSWELSKATGSLPASIELGAGDVFDFRLYSTVISADAITDYSGDVINNTGKNYLPVW